MAKTMSAETPRNLKHVSVTSHIVLTMEQDLTRPISDSSQDYAASMISQIIGVVDTNVILSSLRNDCLHNWDSRLVRSTALGCSVLFAPDHVYEEIYEKLPKLAYDSVSLEQLRVRFESVYLPIIRFVSISDLDEFDPQIINIPDLDDRPTGRLAQLIAPVVVFSDDHDLIDADFAVSEWRKTAGWAADFAETKNEHRISMNLYALPIIGAWQSSKILGRRFKIQPFVPAAILTTLAALGIRSVLRDPTRRENVKIFRAKLLEHYSGQIRSQNSRLHALRGVTYVRGDFPTARQQVAYVLSRARNPILAGEIHQQISSQFGAAECPTIKEIREIITRGTEFIQAHPHRWQLGREIAPGKT